ncbi:pseudouridine synthase [Gautieria morchelliformis]|nr:pseudouridine synthase [Gautieria morchelliformis]
MPKVASSTLNSLFAVVKPSGPASMTVVNTIKPLLSSSRLFLPQKDGKDTNKASKSNVKRRRKRKTGLKDMVKMGTGGTLDPLADGVLVLGLGDGTKQLATFLDCVKEYKTTCLLGCETDSYDSQGVRVRVAPWSHVTRQSIEEVLGKFRGEIMQTPPIFSALKMDGKPLYEYARNGIPLPRPIPPRKVTVHSLDIVDWTEGTDHGFRWPERVLSSADKEKMKKALEGAIRNDDGKPSIEDEPDPAVQDESPRPPTFVLTMKVSGGTYVRSLAHDIGHAVGSAAHVVTLTRTRQGKFTLEPNREDDRACVPWQVFEEAAKEDEGAEEMVHRDENGYRKWEAEVLKRLVLFDDGANVSAIMSTTEMGGTDPSVPQPAPQVGEENVSITQSATAVDGANVSNSQPTTGLDEQGVV